MDSGLGHFQLVSQQSLTIVTSTASQSFDPAWSLTYYEIVQTYSSAYTIVY